MELLSNVPLPLLVLLIFTFFLTLFGLIILLVTREKEKPKPEENFTSVLPPVQPESEVATDQTINPATISPKLAKENNFKFIFLIFFFAVVAAALPFAALKISQKFSQPEKTATQETKISPSCLNLSITDVLDNPLNQDQLKQLRPGDEVKIVIITNSPDFEKGRFRVNGSAWQEITEKEGNNFVANYILDLGVKKFTIEAEVYHKEKGWL